MSFDDDIRERPLSRVRFATIPEAVSAIERFASRCIVDECAAVLDDSGEGVLVLFGPRAALLETPYAEHYAAEFRAAPQRAGELDVLVIAGEQVGRMPLSARFS